MNRREILKSALSLPLLGLAIEEVSAGVCGGVKHTAPMCCEDSLSVHFADIGDKLITFLHCEKCDNWYDKQYYDSWNELYPVVGFSCNKPILDTEHR